MTDKEPFMHACSYADPGILEKTEETKSLYLAVMNRGQRKLKHFTTASEIKSYQKYLQKNKPQEMITQNAYVTNSFTSSECKT